MGGGGSRGRDRKDGSAGRQRRALSSLTVSGFKSITHETKIDFKNLTILAGANSSGKSTMMQSLLLLKQTLESPIDTGALRISGPNTSFTKFDQMLSWTEVISSENLTICIDGDDGCSLGLSFSKIAENPIVLTSMIGSISYSDPKKLTSFSVIPTMTSEELNKIELFMNKLFIYKVTKYLAKDMDPPNDLKLSIRRDHCFLSVVASIPDADDVTMYSPLVDSYIPRSIMDIIHVPGLRGNPERSYIATAISSSFSGTFDNYTASVIHHLKSSQPGDLEKLGRALAKLGLTSAVDTTHIDDTRIEVKVARLLGRDAAHGLEFVNIADVGFGVSQVLPVVAALLIADPGQLVYIEQPELHLHPRAQVALADIIVDAALRGVRVVVETHSHLLILGIQSAIAADQIDPKDVALHWFSRDDSGVTRVQTAELDTAGAFGDWPVDFSNVELDAHNRYIELAEKKLFQG